MKGQRVYVAAPRLPVHFAAGSPPMAFVGPRDDQLVAGSGDCHARRGPASSPGGSAAHVHSGPAVLGSALHGDWIGWSWCVERIVQPARGLAPAAGAAPCDGQYMCSPAAVLMSLGNNPPLRCRWPIRAAPFTEVAAGPRASEQGRLGNLLIRLPSSAIRVTRVALAHGP